MDNSAQADFWTEAGQTWVAQQAALDALFRPVLEATLQGAALAPGLRVLDIGCGAGASTLAAARIVGPTGHVTGLDIAAPFLARAETWAQETGTAQVDFLLADAGTHAFAPSYDRLISRFGVMFFEDPTAAFANLGRAMNPGGRASLSAWGQIPENPWFTEPARCARAHFGPSPKTDPDAPGPFAFRDPERVTLVLQSAGWVDIEIVPTDIPLTPAGGIDAAVDLCCQIGPIPAVMAHHNGTPDDLDAIRRGLIAAWDTETPLAISSQINMISAVWPGA